MRRVKTTVVLSDDLKAALERTARERGISQSEVVRQAVANMLARVEVRSERADPDQGNRSLR